MKPVHLFLALLVLTFSPLSVSAECSTSSLSIPDCIAVGFSAGFDAIMENTADDMINTATNTSNANISKNDPLQSFVLNLLDPSFDPANIPWVVETRNFTALIYVILAVIYFTWGAAFHMLREAAPGIGSELDWVFHTNYKEFYFSQYAVTGIKAFIFPVLGYFMLTYLLMISGAFTRLALSDVMANLAPAKMDPTVYLIMAAITLLLAVFIAMRYIIITIFSAFLLIVLGAYLFEEIRPIAAWLLKYLVTLIFMPFILAMIAAGGIAFIESTPFVSLSRPVAYIALGLIMFLAALVMVLGWSIISRTAKTAGYAAVAV